ncbi:MAG TPA: hypothetical protein VKV22_05020 [Rhodanobacteraceae bacterium]|nr:hypothetical protein [Rhodanobacteraceae bacterium]
MPALLIDAAICAAENPQIAGIMCCPKPPSDVSAQSRHIRRSGAGVRQDRPADCNEPPRYPHSCPSSPVTHAVWLSKDSAVNLQCITFGLGRQGFPKLLQAWNIRCKADSVRRFDAAPHQ